jgi:hypothetical protein
MVETTPVLFASFLVSLLFGLKRFNNPLFFFNSTTWCTTIPFVKTTAHEKKTKDG